MGTVGQPGALAGLPPGFVSGANAGDAAVPIGWNHRARYLLKPDDEAWYDYKYKLEAGPAELKIFGHVQYKATAQNAFEFLKKNDKTFEQEKISGNGTGFFIHPDGLMLTCAHVVGGMETVNIVYGGKELTGVVAMVDH